MGLPLFPKTLVLVSLLLVSGTTAAAGPSGPAAVDSARMASAASEPAQWLSDGRTYDASRYSPLTQIDPGNVSRLGLAWYADLDTYRGVEATPLFIDGVLYNISAWDVTTAYDARAGKALWTYDPQVPREWGRYACCEPVSRGLAAWQGKIIIGTLDGRLIALNANDGKPLWTTQTFDKKQPYSITGAPRVFDGIVVVGEGGADLGVRGYVAAFDANDGRELWRFWIVPGEPAKGFESDAMKMAAATWSGQWWTLGGGGAPWDSIAYDPKLVSFTWVRAMVRLSRRHTVVRAAATTCSCVRSSPWTRARERIAGITRRCPGRNGITPARSP